MTEPDASEYPEIKPGFGDEADQEKVAAGIVTLEINIIPAGCPEQIEVSVGLLVTWGTGKTSRSNVLGSPVHPSAEAVIEYVTVEVTFPEFANCC